MKNEMSAKEKYRKQVKTAETIRTILTFVLVYIPMGLGAIAISDIIVIPQVLRGIMIICGLVSTGCFADSRIKYLIEQNR